MLIMNLVNVMKTTISVRIGYDETDQMGFAHHSNYIKYCERARSEFSETAVLATVKLKSRVLYCLL